MKHPYSHLRPCHIAVVIAACMALMVTACRKEKVFSDTTFQFTATTERLANDAGENSKVFLQNERAIIWEYDDSISIGSNTSNSSEKYVAWLHYNGAMDPGDDFADYNGVFLTTLPEDSKYFLGLHPCSRNNVIASAGGTSFTSSIYLPANQTYRNDSTFDKQVFPMVAWYGGEWEQTPFNLDFHSLGAIVRVQLFNSTGAAATINNITFTSDSKQLVGLFNVHDYNTNNPYLTATDNSSNRTVTLDFTDYGPTFNDKSLVTFYLVLPALGGREVTTTYTLEMTVNSNLGSCTRTMRVPTRRNGITNMQALSIDAWNTTPTNIGLSGCGTSTRPFKVYTIQDLQYLRDCYNAATPPAIRYINGQPITANTHIRIMRSDIVLNAENWSRGIANFVGKLTCVAASNTPGITNNSSIALFESILSGGEVKGLTVKSNTNHSGSADFSPLCLRNSGTLEDCAITSTTGISSGLANLAGIVVNNNGTVKGCRCSASLSALFDGKVVAGICYNNTGTIQGCMSASPMTVPSAANAAGIAYINGNSGKVKDCYFASRITNTASTVNWGGIVYNNEGTVDRCYISSTASILCSGSVGGIVHTNAATGKINYCWSESSLQGTSLGSIADSSAGIIINCYVNSSDAMAILTHNGTSSIVGGLVAVMTGGTIANSFVNNMFITRRDASDLMGGFVGKVTGGAITNCYSNESSHVFYGASKSITYTNCYLFGGSQTHVTTTSMRQSDLATLTTSLNTNRPSGGYLWTQPNASTPPILRIL